MSLDVYLNSNNECVFEYNITHNLNKMADAAGIYQTLWRPEEIGAVHSKDIIEHLKHGLIELVTRCSHYKTFEPANGWGTYEGLVKFVTAYLTACCEYPEALIEVSR